jgi:hypothetical protein
MAIAFVHESTVKADAIFDLRARQIACDWHGGQDSPLYALCSSGAIVEGIDAEIAICASQAREHGEDAEHYRLRQLSHYVQANGPRGPVANWSLYNRL